MKKTSELPNIGKELEKLLSEIGINNEEELKIAGTEKTFIRLNAIANDACLSKLMAIEGALQGIRWHQINPARKEELKAFFYQVKKRNNQNTIPTSIQKYPWLKSLLPS